MSPLDEHDWSIEQRVLVVDDDAAILRMVQEKLSQAGYEVFTALSGREALEVIERRGLPHLAIVDIVMPGMNGFEFCQAVHEFSDLPIILLSAVDEEETVIRGIRHYAEDYVTKPFSPRELVARVERVIRRVGDFSFTLDPVVHVDQRLGVNFGQRQAIIDGRPVPLTATESRLLYILMRNGGRTVNTESLLRRLWPLDEVYADTLRVHVCRLRRKIEVEPSQPRYLVTEREVGYRFEMKG
ncbi:MAG: response regulator transcription factor [Chloroflexi bacterium]|nr:response regulator transcription factor [Chloroflexota bacterium]